MKRSTWLMLALCLAAFSCQNASAQPPKGETNETVGERGKDWYYGPTTPHVEPKSIGRQKAELRAQQRMARLEAMRWYGFSASRPVATGMPFTSMFSPAWRQPGGRPFAWYYGHRNDHTRTHYLYY